MLDSQLSFKTSKNWMGGTLNGISAKLEYIKGLGMDAIWLSPLFVSSAYHGYSVSDYFDVDPHFGSKADLKFLVSKAHKLGLKIILDFVANHVSSTHPFFLLAQKYKSSNYFHWFLFNSWPSGYEHFLDSKGLPKINLENEEAEKYILEVAQFWIREFGIDGYRLDFAVGPPMSFWNDFAKSCRQLNSNFILLPEIWLSGLSKKYLKTMWFVKHDPDQREKLYDLLGKKKPSSLDSRGSAEELAMQIFANVTNSFLDFPRSFELRKMAEERKIRSNQFSITGKSTWRFVFLDNHDVQRIMWVCRNDANLFVELLELLASFENVVVYYGTEIGMTQLKNFRSHSDIEARRFMKWDLKEDEKQLLGRFRRVFAQ